MLYFVARTDVTKDSGQQRVFGCWDTWVEANDFIVNSLSHLRGDFKVFGGSEIATNDQQG